QLLAVESDPRRDFAHLGEAQRFKASDVRPAEVEFIPSRRQLGRRSVSVMVVVQLFAADHDAPGHDVAAGILAGEVPVPPEVAQTVDYSGRGGRNPSHLHRPSRQSDGAETYGTEQ